MDSSDGFGSIHFYTQWFQTLGAEPLTIFLGGIIAIGIAILLKRLNKTDTGGNLQD